MTGNTLGESVGLDTANIVGKFIPELPPDFFLSMGTTTSVPHRCPVCKGRGNVPHEFYSGNSGISQNYCNPRPKCKSCNGKGIVY